MCSLTRYLHQEDALVWLAMPDAAEDSVEGWLGELVLGELEDHVVEMERYLTEADGDEPRWMAARPMVLQQIRKSAGDAVTSDQVCSKAARYCHDLTAEGKRLEEELMASLSALVQQECRRHLRNLPRTSDADIVCHLETYLRPKVHRLVELPLWLRAAESCAGTAE
eukprot:TRINITY_DN77188_c0_g1_i1.p2 TRINITY_DN77188_c0_g1~~TRINITY_DN77188_c0_g1_i1.p2  ORF type:complete len:167 (+),score=62.72 TRINITY_DN77188_c0_g1_i1:158-658(+)